MISLIHPSRSRPELAYKTALSWIENAGCEVEYILSSDIDDPKRNDYQRLFSKFILKWTEVIFHGTSAIDAINLAAKSQFCTGNILIQISDDFQCFPNWGKKIEEFMKNKVDWILKTQDGIQPWIITLPIMDRTYYERFGYIYHPSYKHAWSDTELTCVAELTGCKHTSQMFFRHLNDGQTKIVDELSKRNDATYEEGKSLFIERKKRNFDLAEKDIVGRMTSNYYTQLQ